jgi:hypothetical protein
MTTASATISSGVTDTTTLRAAGSAISGLFSTAGLTKASDTGQVNWTTITWTTGTSTLGFEIWKCNDSLQSTKPVYMKVTYTQTSNVIRISTVQLATGTDGAGTLNGVVGISLSASSSSVSASTTTWVACGDGSGISFCSSQSIVTTANSVFFWFDRSRDGTGVITSESVNFGTCQQGGVTSSNTGTIEFTSGVAHNSSSNGGAILAPVNNLVTTLSTGTDVYVVPCTYGANGKLLPPPLALVGYINGDIAAGSTITVSSIDGSSHTFLCLGLVGTLNNGGTALVPAMRWE